MHEIAEGLIREISKKPAKDGLLSDDLARKMHLANLAQNPEEFENIYLNVINNTNITSEVDLFNTVLALEKLSIIYLAQGDYQKSIDILVNNFNKVSGKEVDLTPALMIRVSVSYLEWGDTDKAKVYLDKYKDLVDNTQGEFYDLLKNEFKGRVNLIEGVIDAKNGDNIDSSYAKMQKGINQMFKGKSSNEGLPIANAMMQNFIQIGRFDYAYEMSKPIIEAYKNNFNDRLLKGVKISTHEKESIKNVLSNFIYVAEKTDKTELDFGFEIMQLAAGLDASDALIKTIYKKKIGLDASLLIDKLEVLRLEKKMIIKEKLSKITSNNDDALDVNSKLDSIDSEIGLIQKELEQMGLGSNSINLFVSSAKNVIDMLHKKDALLTMLVSKERTFVWLVTSNGVYRHHANIGSDVIKGNIKKLLSSLNPSQSSGIRFPMEASSKLYDLLIRPFEKQLKEIDRLVIAPDSILSSIPFSILSDVKDVDIGEKIDYIDTLSTRGINKVHANISASNINKNNWLINRFAITIVPSIYSYIESEKLSKIGLDPKDSFIGIGNPILNGTIDKASKQQLVAHINTRGSISNFVSEMAPLPETEKELSMVAKSFSKSDLFFGENATEVKLKEIDLSQYSVVSFATHALVSNEIESIVEPSLILTPVDENNPNNDGILTASEISNLKLDAEIVLLSACNTASSFGESNSQGLSGLANSFFNAGARSLLVSYWSVISES
ncbi:CHAT domain-containing protein, partial [bacterium]|nr:CHAT domain-containing protein [bacterium]